MDLRCYRLHDTLDNTAIGGGSGLDRYIELPEVQENRETRYEYGPISGAGFEAKLYVSIGQERRPPWMTFLRAGFADLDMPMLRSVGATLIIWLRESGDHFALTFGTTGRHLLRDEAWQRAYGMRTALNLIYRQGVDPNRLFALRAKRRGPHLLRSDSQSSAAITLEEFGVDRRNVIGGVTGAPIDKEEWGARVTGSDALAFESDRSFGELRDLCRLIDAAWAGQEAQRLLPWLQEMQPVSEPDEILSLQEEVLRLLRSKDDEHVDIAPPEVIDWQHIIGFNLPQDRWKRIESKGVRPELRLTHVLQRLEYLVGLENVNIELLRRRYIVAVDDDGRHRHRWSIWRCLVAQFQLNKTTYVLDEGDFFAVDRDFLVTLNTCIDSLEDDCSSLVPAKHCEKEPAYIARIAQQGALAVLHEGRMKPRNSTTHVEICDILTADHRLIHIKRHLGARNLSYLFAQGLVSAKLLQDDEECRLQAAIAAEATNYGYADLLPIDPLRPDAWQVLYGVIADWRGRRLSEGMPLFGKLDLQSVAEELRSRRFRVGCHRIDLVPAEEAVGAGSPPA